MRSTNCPPCCRTNARLNSDMYAVPTCGSPVGDGATRSRTGSVPSATSGHAVDESPDALDLDDDLVTDLHRPDPGRRAGEDDVARQQGHARGDVGDQIRDLVHDLARPTVLLRVPGQRRGDAQVVRVGLGL